MRLIVDENSVPRIHLIGTLVIVLLLTLGLGAFFSWQHVQEGRAALARIEQATAQQMRGRLQVEMDSTLGFIDFARQRTEARLRHALVEHVDSAFQIAEAIHRQESPRRPAAEVKRMIVEALRPVRFFGGGAITSLVKWMGVSCCIRSQRISKGGTSATSRTTPAVAL